VIRPSSIATALAVLAVTAACGGSGGGTGAVASGSPDPTVVALQQRAALGAKLAFTGSYAVSDTTKTTARVGVWVTPGRYRVEVAEGTVTAALYGTAAGTVACPGKAGQPPVCFTVAAAGKPVPAAFDAGIERVFTRDLPALSAGARGFRVTSVQPDARVSAAVAGVACYTVRQPAAVPPLTDSLAQLVDQGTYCLGPDGTPAELRFASGTLTLSRKGRPPTAAELTPPAAPRPLPKTSATGTASPTTSPFPTIFPSPSKS
jgi:hypothetical protein